MIRLANACVKYPSGTQALSDVTLEIADGEFAFIVGRSGAGKSTVIKLITGEVPPAGGRVEVNGFSLSRMRRSKIPFLRRTLGVVYQDFRLIDRMSVFENVAFAMRVIGVRRRQIDRRVRYVLNLVGLSERADRLPGELSGGEQQRVAIARALVNNPSVIIADEPTGNLDPERSYEIMRLLEQINELGSTVIVITHEKELVNRFSKRVVTIENGRVVSDRMGGYGGSGVFIDV